MLTALAALVLGQGLSGRTIMLHPIGPNQYQVQIMQRAERLEPPQLSPKKFGENQWIFEWITVGLGVTTDPNQLELKVRVYSQERKENDKGLAVARMAMQIWDRAYHRLKVEGPANANRGIVDFYLSFGGTAGGEQEMRSMLVPDIDDPNKLKPVTANTIYIYRLDTFKDPVEMAREVAHEYGHAILPGIGGFKQPEVWANGYLGEKLFLSWIRDDMAAKQLEPVDAMGATLPALTAWVAKNVDPLVKVAATRYPDPNLINESAGGMDAFNGLAMYIQSLCPARVFIKSIEYTRNSQNVSSELKPPTEFAANVVVAASEEDRLALSVPKAIFDTKKPIWIPIGKGTVSGATLITKKNGWAQVLPLAPNIIVKNPPIG
jgi:hypothetical protein